MGKENSRGRKKMQVVEAGVGVRASETGLWKSTHSMSSL